MRWAPKTWNIDSRCWLTVTHTHTQLGIWVSIKHGISPLKLRRWGKMTQPEGEFSPLMKVHQFHSISSFLLARLARLAKIVPSSMQPALVPWWEFLRVISRWGTNWMIRRGPLCWETSKASTKPGGDGKEELWGMDQYLWKYHFEWVMKTSILSQLNFEVNKKGVLLVLTHCHVKVDIFGCPTVKTVAIRLVRLCHYERGWSAWNSMLLPSPFGKWIFGRFQTWGHPIFFGARYVFQAPILFQRLPV